MRERKPSGDAAASGETPLLNTVAEKIGSTLGVIAAKAGAVQKAVTPGKQKPAKVRRRRRARKASSSKGIARVKRSATMRRRSRRTGRKR